MLDLSVKKAYGSHPEIMDLSPLGPKLKASYGDVSGFKTPTYVGIEVEMEKQTLPAATYLWKCIEDGSLKDVGKEYVSLPLKDEFVIYALEEYEKGILKYNPKTEFSHRCSIHVHMDVTKLTVGQLRALMATYLATENLFFALVQDHRIGNSYCYPLMDLCTKDKKEILNWIETILQLYKFVGSKNPLEVTAQINQLNTVSNYFEFIQEVFGKKANQFAGMRLYPMLRTNVTAAKVFLG